MNNASTVGDSARKSGALLTLSDLAARWGVCDRTLRGLLAGGGVPCLRVGSRARFRLADIEAWEERAAGAAPEGEVIPAAAAVRRRREGGRA